ncbi:MAG: glycosyltransferase [Prevotellaceae bacterium]|jgi:glycosyltransferase involved in cell wall biosynthesis|nr:glycosyltransferase [Prevotellaceae bacterium]
MNYPLVSVIIPVYNMQDYLAETIDSVLNSDYSNFEVIIIDDGSTDNSAEIARNYAEKYKKIKLFTQKNSGVSAARNHAIKLSEGKYILPVDADDLISPEYIKKAVEVLEKNPQFKVVCCEVEWFGDRNKKINYPPFSYRLLARKNLIVSCALFRKSDWQKAGGYCEEEIFCEDWDFWLSMFQTGGEFIRLPFVGLKYRFRKNSRRTNAHKNKKLMIDKINLRHKSFINEQLGGKLRYSRTWSRFINFFCRIVQSGNDNAKNCESNTQNIKYENTENQQPDTTAEILKNKSETKKIVLVEFFPYHTECLYSQLLFLKSGNYSITLVCDIRVEKIVKGFGVDGIDFLFFDFKKLKSLFKFRKFLLKEKINQLILNTAQGSIPLKFIFLPLPKSVRLAGIIHDTEKVLKSRGQKIICSKLSAYYVLAPYVYIPDNTGLKATYFEPAFYPSFSMPEIEKYKDDIWLCVPGTPEYKRRDYHFLLAFAQHPNLSERIKFVLLGNSRQKDGIDFIKKIHDATLEKRFIYFEYFASDELFHSYIKKSDYIFPLIHPDTPDAESYTKYKISGMFPLAKAYHKTMLCHQIFEQTENFLYRTLFYKTADELIDLLNETKQPEIDYFADFEENKNRYLSVLP